MTKEATHMGVAGFVTDQDGEEVEGAKVSEANFLSL